MSSNYAVLGLGMAAAGPLTDAVGARWVWGGSACLVANKVFFENRARSTGCRAVARAAVR